MRIGLTLTDVRWAVTLADYAGELEGEVTIRLTDNGRFAPITNPPETVQDLPLRFPASCTATVGPEGGGCAAATTADALVGGMVREGNRAVWELGPVEVRDGGPDGDVDTPDNAPFARQGIFVP